MKLTFEITMNGTTERVKTLPRDILAVERRAGRSFAKIAADMTMDEMMWLSWRAHARGRAPFPAYEEWTELIEDWEVLSDDAAPLPEVPSDTAPVASTG
jgi:hypothetical protein